VALVLVLGGVCVVVDVALELVDVLVCIVDGAVLVSVTMPVGTDVVVVTLPADAATVEVEETSAEAVVSAIVVA